MLVFDPNAISSEGLISLNVTNGNSDVWPAMSDIPDAEVTA